MADGGGVSPENLGAEEIARTNQYVEKQGPDGGMMPRADRHEAGSIGTDAGLDNERAEQAYYKGSRENKDAASVTANDLGMQKGSQGSEVPEASDSVLKRLINRISKPPKQN